MGEDWVHLMAFQDVVQRIYFKELSPHSEMISYWVKLYPMNRLFQLESLNCLISSIIYNIKPAFLPSGKNVVALASKSVNV